MKKNFAFDLLLFNNNEYDPYLLHFYLLNIGTLLFNKSNVIALISSVVDIYIHII